MTLRSHQGSDIIGLMPPTSQKRESGPPGVAAARFGARSPESRGLSDRAREFFFDWLTELRACGPTARRLFLRRLAQQYRYSSFGILWAFVPPALATLMLIGGQRAHIVGSQEGVPAAFYGVFGLAIVQTFLEAINATRRVFASHAELLRRQNVPLDGLIVAALLDTAFTMLIRIAIVAVAFFVFSVQPAWPTVALAAAGFVGVAFLGAGLGLLVAPLASLKRDVENMFTIFPWLLLAVTPVFMPPPAGSLFARVCEYNSLTRILDGMRAAAYGGAGTPSATLRGLIAGAFLLVLGWAFCRFARPHVVERTLA